MGTATLHQIFSMGMAKEEVEAGQIRMDWDPNACATSAVVFAMYSKLHACACMRRHVNAIGRLVLVCPKLTRFLTPSPCMRKQLIFCPTCSNILTLKGYLLPCLAHDESPMGSRARCAQHAARLLAHVAVIEAHVVPRVRAAFHDMQVGDAGEAIFLHVVPLPDGD